MAQVLTVASLVAVLGWLGWHYADRLFERRQQAASHPAPDPSDRARFERRIYKAPANEFLRGAADLTFGALILFLGFFMLMWVIATA
jgi:hypothetical protein